MNRPLLLPSTLIACLLLSGIATAQCRLTGNVKSAVLPLPNALVTLSRGQQEIARSSTGADGRFTVDYPAFTELRTIVVLVSAKGHSNDERRLFRLGLSPCLETRKQDVVLERRPADTAGSPDNDANTSALGLTIFIAPYAMYGDEGDKISESFNKDLPQIIHHRILAYQSGLNLTSSYVDISVDTTKESLTPAQGERIRRVGLSLNALGMIAGDGELITTDDGEQAIDLTSIFRTIPSYRDHGVMMQPINDQLTARRTRPSRVAGQLRDEWGKQAMLSYVLQRLASGIESSSITELNELDDLLIGVRNTMTKEDRLLAPLEALRLAIAKEKGE